MVPTPVLITAGVFAGVYLIVSSLYYLLTRFRPHIHQFWPPPPLPPTVSFSAEDPKEVLKAIPVVCYSRDEGVRECSVCLSSVEEGEKVRILPDCGHGFHAGCIDEWLWTQLSCPFCRSPVKSPAKSSDTKPEAVEPLAGLMSLLSTKISFWQNRKGQSSSRDDDANGGGELEHEHEHEREESSPV